MLKNEEYKEHFIKRFTQLISTSFSYEKTSAVLDSMKSIYQEDMVIHAKHWERSVENWGDAIRIVDDYLQRRPDTVLNHIRDFFALQEPVPVSISVEPPGAGTISFSGLDISSEPLYGKFFPGMSYQVQSTSVPGFSFDKWMPFQGTEDSINFQLTESMEIIAYFLPSDHSFPIQICEVYSNNRVAYDAGDWREFYYYGSESIPLDGWYITGDNGQLLYTFRENTIIHPGQRFVICEDMDRFKKIFPMPLQCFGNLRASQEWPVLPNEGFSIELKSIVADTEKGNQWELSENIFGSPGLPNNTYYNFQPPSGKDSAFNNHETHFLEFTSSRGFYMDADHHDMAGISVKELSGPGLFYRGETEIEQGKIYEPSDLVFSPQEPYSNSSALIYSFIDKSGQESADHTIMFNPAVNAKQSVLESFDLNGRMLQKLHSKSKGHQLHIDLSMIKSGIYFYRINTRQASVNGKIEVIK